MAFDAFLKIATIPGECNDDKHKDWIEVLSYNHNLTQPVAGSVSTSGGRAAERCNHSDFSVMKQLDKASPKIALACCNGEHIPEVTIQICRAAGDKQPYMIYKMSDVIISSYSPSGSSGGDVPSESVSFNYGKIVWTYTETDHKTGKAKGNVEAHWDLGINKGG